MTVRILTGDVRDMLATLPDESVHCVVTSPPYWGLRDYGVTGQLGMEPTMGEHIDTMVDVFREVRRVLRKDGTVWLNYGDCYATAPNGRSAADTKATGNDDRTFRDKPFSTVGPICDPNYRKRTSGGIHAERRDDRGARVVAGGYLKPKDLCMIPNRLAIALQDDGWWVRSEIIWAKPNPMPESVTDRPATAHEKIWLLTKSARYFYDAEAVKTQAKWPDGPNAPNAIKSPHGQGFTRRAQKMPDGWDTGPGAHGTIHRNGREKGAKVRGLTPRHDGHINHTKLDETPRGTANLRNVWTIPTKGFSGAHYATFPPDLIVPCIKAGCPKGGTVLDPFIGSGTTAMVADRLGRDCIGIDLNPENVEMATDRITADAGLFAEVAP